MRLDVYDTELTRFDEAVCKGCGAIPPGRVAFWTCQSCGRKNRPGGRGERPRAKTESLREMRRHLHVVQDEPTEQRPRTRGECAEGPRPCPWVGCRHHLAYEVTPAGGLKEKFPGVELEDMKHTCALDIADMGAQSEDTVALLSNVSRERVRQIEKQGMDAFRAALPLTKDDL